MIVFYRYLMLVLIIILPLFPIQLDIRINYLIYLYAILLLPVFFKPFWSRVKAKEPVTLAWVLFLLSAAASTYISIDQQRSLLMLGIYLSTFIIFISASKIFPSLKDKEKIILALLLVSCFLSLISLYNTLFLHYINRNRIGVSFMWIYYSHNHLSALLLFALPLNFYLLTSKWKKPILRYCLLLAACSLLLAFYFTFSKGVILTLFIASGISLAIFKLISKKRLLLVLIAMIVSLLIFFSTLKENGQYFGVNRYNIIDNVRPIYWQKGIENGLNHPFFGTGLDTARYINYPKKIIKADYSHNILVQLFSDGGWMGLLSGILLIVAVFYQSIKLIKKDPVKYNLKIFLFTALLSSFLLALVDFDWQLPAIFLIFWVIISLLPENPAN